VTIDDPDDYVGNVMVRIDGEQLAGFDQRSDDRPMLGTAVGASEQRVLAVQGQWADSALDHVVVDLNAAVVEEEAKPDPT